METFNGHLLNEPWEVQNNSGQYFKVFTPYWRKAFDVYQSKKEKIGKLNSLNVLRHQENSNFNFLPDKNWYQKFSQYWTPGEKSAHEQLSQYLKKDIDVYKEARDRPDLDQTSKLSPYLRFGEISARTIVLNILKAKKINTLCCNLFIRDWLEGVFILFIILLKKLILHSHQSKISKVSLEKK